jgi:hydroxymethylbilane synthase
MSPTPERLVIASRGSKLAVTQARSVVTALRLVAPDISVDLMTVSTKGDKDSRPFEAIGGKGLFMAEVEREVAEGRADVAVHSAKDLTAELAPGCMLLCIPERAPAADVVVGGTGSRGEERLGSLLAGARVGTSSMRRRALLAEARPDLSAVELRGNLDTRLGKVAAGEVDAAILAAAGLGRLGASEQGAELDEAWWVPAPAQGALAVEALAEREDLAEMFAPLADPAATAEVACERAFAAELEGGCSVPLGCRARFDAGRLVATGYLGDAWGENGLRDRISGPAEEAASLGRDLARAILDGGGRDLLEALQDQDVPRPAAP